MAPSARRPLAPQQRRLRLLTAEKCWTFPQLTYRDIHLSLGLRLPCWMSACAALLLACKSLLSAPGDPQEGCRLSVRFLCIFVCRCFNLVSSCCRWKSLYTGHVLSVPVTALGTLLLLGSACVPEPGSKQLHYATKRESVPSPLA